MEQQIAVAMTATVETRASELTDGDIVDRLAARLFWELETLDPQRDTTKWADLSDEDRELYRQTIFGLLEERSLLETALQRRLEYL